MVVMHNQVGKATANLLNSKPVTPKLITFQIEATNSSDNNKIRIPEIEQRFCRLKG